MIGQVFDWAGRHPARALLAAMALWAAGFAIYWNVTAHSRFVGAFENAVWNWMQAGESARTLDPEDRRKLFEQLASSSPPARWDAAGKLGGWRDPAALGPLIAAMQDDAGTRRTCVISQALGKLGDLAAVPALLRAAQHPDNLDLRVCATHSLGQIGDESAIEFLANRATDPSVPDGERGSVISALGEIGSPLALTALESILASSTRLSSFAASSIKQIGLLQGDAGANLLAAIGDNADWIHDDWLLTQLHRRWDDRIAETLNERLRESSDLHAGLRLQIAALLTVKRRMESATVDFLTSSRDNESRWLADLAGKHATDPQLLALHP
jgi:HEAT repeat protein